METINLGNHKIYKISHGAQKFFPYEKIKEWEKEKIVVVHGETGYLANSPVTQGDVFLKRLNIGDYFYLCHGAEDFLVLGKIKSDAKKMSPDLLKPFLREGYYYRKYEVIKIPVIHKPYKGEKHWWSPNGISTICEISNENLDLANELIFKKYFDVKIDYSEIKEKISKICWNSNFWQFPSGSIGKSKDRESYEYKNGFGHEEWLGNKIRKIDNMIYGYLQAIGKYRDEYGTYIGEKFNISLYSRDETIGKNFVVGKITNAEVITYEDSIQIHDIYKNRGWLSEMVKEVENAKGKANMLYVTKPKDFFNIKYKTSDIKIFDTPIKIKNPKEYLQNNYYYQFLNKINEPDLDTSINKTFQFKKGHNESKTEAVITYTENTKIANLVHNKFKNIIYKQLKKKYKDNVGTENDTGFASKVDIVGKVGNKHIFYEIKTGHNLKLCIREALAQLLEYAYFPNKENANQLIIVTHHDIENGEQEYLHYLRNRFKIPVWYQKFNSEMEVLEDKLY